MPSNPLSHWHPSITGDQHGKLKSQIKQLSANGNAGFIEAFTSITDGLGLLNLQP
jgi:hypothetical protein